MTQQTDTRTKLLTVPPFKLMLSLSIPVIIGMVVVGLYNFMDRVFVGQLINEVAMGAQERISVQNNMTEQNRLRGHLLLVHQ